MKTPGLVAPQLYTVHAWPDNGVAGKVAFSLSPYGFLDEERVAPGNHLEALKRDRKGQHSIRINDQCRVCFVWTADGPKNIEIVDYH